MSLGASGRPTMPRRSRDCCALAGVSPEITVVARAFWRPLASAVGLFPKGPGWAIGKWQRAGRITASLLSFDLGMACPPAGRLGANDNSDARSEEHTTAL